MIDNYIDWLESKNIVLNNDQKDNLNRYTNLVNYWNKKVNITAAKDLKEIVERHILDSLMPLIVGFDNEKSVIDLGSGGGFPAIPLAIILKETKFLLVEKVTKKCAFLKRVKRELNLKNIEVENSLFEEIDYTVPQTMITRAVKIDKKIETYCKEKGIKKLYSFHSTKPVGVDLYAEYILPGENKVRYIARRELHG
ncbi:16S rRNA (guanine527-N7)-methyltransferase [Thermotomaculum hydrothermale]|uniref:Ribosomal RNA small subunit methyltransferase G n=1 Tax=Thermotomaculum hydrothermale TaxID=981385 RepID=A0A7R6PFU7_9BACT|nr:16S rRNA (guanine(527)-N(7))-methyltransferase RsmG [Thermotomaculum hydrothermale]BBB32958.1 16S rRNA (guanine527-N7)-methyltransferase [Thermotomaculum hydrothermale]